VRTRECRQGRDMINLPKGKGGSRNKRRSAVYTKKNMESETSERPVLSLQNLPHSQEENRLLLHRGNYRLYLQPQIYCRGIYPPE